MPTDKAVNYRGCCVVGAALVLFAVHSAIAEEISFNRDVRPILGDRCFACHGPDANTREGDLRLDITDAPDGAYRTHDGITAIKPGSLEDSELWHRVTTTKKNDLMPPADSHKKPLKAKELAVIKKWIESGAKYEGFWAFEPPRKPVMPTVRNASWSKQPIDLLVLKKLERSGMQPSDEADKRTLIRRVTFHLTGLPPTRDQIRAFVNDKSPDAYERLVDRLLAQPQYGEHFGRYWLDLVRYADTNGMHKDFYRNNIAYRDWIIRAFNNNLGYDDFLRYQLAGDLYEKPTDDQLVASGFNRLHLIIDRGTALPEESFAKNVFDRVTAVGTAFLGLTAQCAMCHDHKYDPLTQKDFYSLFAFFNNIDAAPETAGRPRNGLQPPFIALASPEQTNKLEEFDRALASFDQRIKLAKDAAAKATDVTEKENAAQQAKKIEGQRNALKKQRDQFNASIPQAMVTRERKEIRPTFILKRGEYDKPGERVERNTPGFLPPLQKKSDVASRMDLAEWFVQPDHPLTARVAVNRFWQQLFGVGLVKTSEDLGGQGEVPSHPQLLDYLAVSFVESGWDIKALAKQIVMSKTYRQSSLATTEQYEADPENRLLSRGSRVRLDAEMIRDQILATSGLLSTQMYGKSVKPPQPDGLWKAVTMIGERYVADKGDAIHRRSLYTYWKRGMPPPQMTILNAPIRDACIARRERTNTPAQALLLLNESQYLKAARHLAQHTLAQPKLDTAARLAFAYETVTGQLPDEKETRILAALLVELEKKYREAPALAAELCKDVKLDSADARAQLAAWTIVGNTLYNLDITKTLE